MTAKAQLAQAEAQQVNTANNLSYTEVKESVMECCCSPYGGTLVSLQLPNRNDVSIILICMSNFSAAEDRLLDLTAATAPDKALARWFYRVQLNDRSVYHKEGR